MQLGVNMLTEWQSSGTSGGAEETCKSKKEVGKPGRKSQGYDGLRVSRTVRLPPNRCGTALKPVRCSLRGKPSLSCKRTFAKDSPVVSMRERARRHSLAFGANPVARRVVDGPCCCLLLQRVSFESPLCRWLLQRSTVTGK